ncbi:MAG: acetylglutamate kinase [Candidatus Brocadiales bacterium]
MKEAIRKADILIEALPYIKAFRDRLVVIKLGGSALTDAGALRGLLEDVIFMKTVGMRPILVHGGGPHISEEMAKRGKEPKFVNGHRITDQETLDIVVDVLMNDVNKGILHELEGLGDGGVNMWKNGHPPLKAEKYMGTDEGGNRIDLGCVGQLSSIEGKAFHRACREGKIPVIPPVARGRGGLLNVNADTVASFIAGSLRAEKLVFLSNTHGIMLDPSRENSTVSSLSKTEVISLIERGVITGGMLPTSWACLRAMESGVKKAHIVDGRIPHSLLLEIFTDKGIGTQIVL